VSDRVHQLGEVLRTAREAKGVDLARVERDTKIRERYLSALERGEYRELPGAVYTKGFLRNYGAYLGLDPEYLIDLYRIETGAVTVERPAVAPRPLAARRARALVLTPNVVAAALLTIAVGGFIAYLAYEFVNFARQPELTITDPVGNVSGYTDDTITVRGITAPNATITVRGLPENPTVVADEHGAFRVRLGLLPGSNEFTLQARDPVTNRDSEEETRVVVVERDVAASPSASPATITLASPAPDATVQSPVAVSGSAAPNAALTVTASLVSAPAPTFTVTDAGGGAVAFSPPAPAAPAPVTLTANATGDFSGTVALPAGTWDLTVAPAAGDPVTTRVTVAPGEGLAGALTLVGGDSYLELDADGAPVAGVSGTIAAAGDRIDVTAARELRIRAGNAGAVHVTINGIDIGAMGSAGAVVEWRISRSGG
jgi:cytoskeletal protein RodZ